MAAIYLEKPPENVYKYLLKIQGEVKSSKGIAVYSLEKTVYKIIEEHEKQNLKASHFDLLNTQYLLDNGWVKIASSSYKRGNDVIVYTGTYWVFNDEKLTEENYLNKIKKSPRKDL